VVQAEIECDSGRVASSEPVVLPRTLVADRSVISEAGWPGYQFAIDGEASLLFCENDRLIRMSAEGDLEAQSDAVAPCGVEGEIAVSADAIAVLDHRGAMAVFDPETLALAWSTDAQMARPVLATGQALVAEFRDDGKQVSVRSLASGELQREIDLGGLGEANDGVRFDQFGDAALRDGVLVVVVSRIELSPDPLEAAVLVWNLDERGSAEPTVLLDLLSDAHVQSSATVHILEGARSALVHHKDTLYAVDLGSAEVVWQGPIEGQPRFWRSGAELIVSDASSVLWFDRTGSPLARTEIEVERILGAHRSGGVYLQAGESALVRLTPQLQLDWTLPRAQAGIAFDASGRARAVVPPTTVFEL
jgi:hypothetical protein